MQIPPTDSFPRWLLYVLVLAVVAFIGTASGAIVVNILNRRKTSAEVGQLETHALVEMAKDVREATRESREVAKENRELRKRVDELCDLREEDKKDCDERLAEQDQLIVVLKESNRVLEKEFKMFRDGTLPQGRDAILD